MFSGRKGYTVSDLAPLAIVFVVLAMTVSMGSLVLSDMKTETYDTATVANESMGNITTVPTIYTVNDASDADFVKLTDETAYNDSAHSGTVASEITDAQAGEVNITENPDDTEDDYLAYDYDEEQTSSTVIDDGINALADFSGWFGVLVVVIISAIIIGIVMKYFGGMAGTAGRKV